MSDATRVLRIVTWLMIGHAIVGALYWGLLQVPESTVWMLALTAALAVLLFVVAAIVEGVAIAWWQAPDGMSATAAARRTSYARVVAGFAIAVLIFWLLSMSAGAIDKWWTWHRGQIDAWLMMRTRSTKVLWVHRVVSWILWFFRYPFAFALGAGALGAWVEGVAALQTVRRLRTALHWRPIVGITIALLLFVVAPWHFVVYWRPQSLPANWLEPTFVAVKLFVVYVLLNTGWAIVLSAGARTSPRT